MSTNNDHDQIVSQYLNRLEAALADVPADERESLVESIATHISEARATLSPHSEAAVRDILDRIGEPADIAREVISQRADLPTGEGHYRAPRRRTVIAIVIAGVAVAVLATLFAMHSPTLPSPRVVTTTTVRARPPKEIVVPNVIGLTQNQALSALATDRFAFEANFRCSAVANQAGMVTSQFPAGGKRADRGSSVQITITKKCT
jgi:hypothetical protein